MAKHDNDFVDINSSSQLNKVYKKKYVKGRVVRAIALALSIIMLIFGTGFVTYYSVVDKVNYQEIEVGYVGTMDQTGNSTTVSTDNLVEDDNVLNILLFGQDSVEEGGGTYGRSDTIILMSIDNNTRKIKLTSFLRDTYVAIPGYGNGKLNAAFSYGGVPLSVQMIQANFGVKIDKYACVDFKSFREIIEILGGVDIELTSEEIRYINAQIDVNNQESKTSYLPYDSSIEKSVVHLDGYQALWYARNRGEECLGGNPEYSFYGSDWERTERQRKLIETIIDSMKEASLTEIVQIVNAIGPLITTNLKKSEIRFFVENCLTFLSYDMIETSMPNEGNWSYGTTSDGQSVISVTDWDKLRAHLNKFIYG